MNKIILNGNDVTSKIKDWSITNNKYEYILTVTYLSNKKFSRPLSECDISPKNELTGNLIYDKKNKSIVEVEHIIELGEKYLYIKYPNKIKKEILKKDEFNIFNKTDLDNSDIFIYLKRVAEERVTNAKNSTDKVIAENIKRQFDKLISYNETALYAYLNKKVKKKNECDNLIYPFGINETQSKAVGNAFKSQISIIEGPPGTGKTQTILNIIANIIINNKTCAIVSNNNKAVENVYDKMEEVNLDFLIAKLGNSENKENFFDNLKYHRLENKGTNIKLHEINDILNRTKKSLKNKNDLACLIIEIKEIEIEKEYLDKWHREHPEIKKDYLKKYNLSSIKTVDLQAYLRILSDRFLSFKDKFELMLHYKIFKNKFLNNIENRQNFIFSLQFTYYEKLLEEKNKEKERLEGILITSNIDNDIELLREESMNYIYHFIDTNMSNVLPNFKNKEYKKDFSKFMKSFPIIGSGTHSLLNSIADGYIFDYVIIDEASQQDIVPGILCFACAKNIIIVGDRKQLNHIASPSKLESPSEFFDCRKYSLLDSISELFESQVPRTLLLEHYRCHPKIIQFCNKQFYHNQLIPMTKDNGEDALSLITTSLGNHTRGFTNLREIESILKVNEQQMFIENKKGFIAPYNGQVNLANTMLRDDFIKATIHKFQGRECDEIVFSTVLDKKKSCLQQINFVDDASLVNVAVSRAKNKFTLVTGNNVFTKNNKHIEALIRYIKYYANEKELFDSPVISGFDLLYSEYDKSLEKLNFRLKLDDSKFKSEQIVAAILREIFSEREFELLILHKQIFLKQLVSMQLNNFSEREIQYMNNNASCDFVIYYDVGKRPLTVIEVDGGYHLQAVQIERDLTKNSILEKCGIPILRLPTTTGELKKKMSDHLRKCVLSID